MIDSNDDDPIHILAGIIGVGTNFYNNWSSIVNNPWSAIGYIATGAVAGVVSLSPGGAFAAEKITAAGNILTDIASGNVPDIHSTSDLLGYAGSTIGNALDVAGSGRLAKLGANGLKSFGIDIVKDQAASLPYSSMSDEDVESIVAAWYGTDVKIADAPTIFGKRSNFGIFASTSLFASAGQAGFGIIANGGIGPTHGGENHNQRIDDWVKKAKENGAQNIRKNQYQVDVNGKTLGKNRPDLQFDKNGTHYNIEWDTNARSSMKHRRVVTKSDPKAISKFFKIFK